MGMKTVKFLHCADIHLDAPFTSLSTEEGKSSERRQDLKLTFRRITETAKSEKVDLLLISGDLYEHHYVRKSTICFINDCFKEIPKIKVVIVPGNHDPNTANSYYRNFNWADNVYILTEENSFARFEDIDTIVYGIGFDSSFKDAGISSGLKGINRGFNENAESCIENPESYINILLCHGTLDMDIGDKNYNLVKSEELDRLGMDYIALGHFHNRMEAQGVRGNIFNPGSPEPLGFDEMGGHGVIMGSILKDENSVSKIDWKFIELSRKTYEEIEVNIDGCCSDEQVSNRILETLGDKDYRNSLLNIVLKGYTGCNFTIDSRVVKSYIGDRAYFVKIKDFTDPDYNFDEISKEPGLKGLYVRKILSMIDESKDEDRARLLKKALYYGIEALERGEICI